MNTTEKRSPLDACEKFVLETIPAPSREPITLRINAPANRFTPPSEPFDATAMKIGLIEMTFDHCSDAFSL